MIYQLITLHQARGFCPKRWQMRRDWTFVGGSACLNRRLFTPIVIQKRTAVIHQLAAVSPPAPEPERTSAYADCCPKTDGRLSTRSSPSPPPAPNLNERPLIPIAAGKRPGRYPPIAFATVRHTSRYKLRRFHSRLWLDLGRRSGRAVSFSKAVTWSCTILWRGLDCIQTSRKVAGTRGYLAVARGKRMIPDPSVAYLYFAIVEPDSYLDFANQVPFSNAQGIVIKNGLLSEVG